MKWLNLSREALEVVHLLKEGPRWMVGNKCKSAWCCDFHKGSKEVLPITKSFVSERWFGPGFGPDTDIPPSHSSSPLEA